MSTIPSEKEWRKWLLKQVKENMRWDFCHVTKLNRVSSLHLALWYDHYKKYYTFKSIGSRKRLLTLFILRMSILLEVMLSNFDMWRYFFYHSVATLPKNYLEEGAENLGKTLLYYT